MGLKSSLRKIVPKEISRPVEKVAEQVYAKPAEQIAAQVERTSEKVYEEVYVAAGERVGAEATRLGDRTGAETQRWIDDPVLGPALAGAAGTALIFIPGVGPVLAATAAPLLASAVYGRAAGKELEKMDPSMAASTGGGILEPAYDVEFERPLTGREHEPLRPPSPREAGMSLWALGTFAMVMMVLFMRGRRG